jgi:two-component system phosphate regulon response regulator PhoB
MRRERLLIIAQERDLLEQVPAEMGRAGFEVATSAFVREAVCRATEYRPDLIIFDHTPAGPDPAEVCTCFKGHCRTCRAAILIVTTPDREPDILAGLEHGADDYYIRPLASDRLLIRCKVLLHRRRENFDAGPVVQVGDFTVDPAGFDARLAGRRLELTPTEFRLLYALVRRPGWVFTRYQIVDAVRGGDSLVGERAVDGQVLSLRRKLGPYRGHVETVRGVGYRFRTAKFE